MSKLQIFDGPNELLVPEMTIVGVGTSCQPFHQAARYATQHAGYVDHESGPFDWLICPVDSVIAWLSDDLPVIQSGEVVLRNNWPYWQKYGLWFRHGFGTRVDGKRVVDIDATFEREQARLQYLRDKFFTLDRSNTVFILSNTQNNLTTDVFEEDEHYRTHISENQRARVEGELVRLLGGSVNMHTVVRQDRTRDDFHAQPNVSLLPAEESEWKGNDAHWDAVFDELRTGLPVR